MELAPLTERWLCPIGAELESASPSFFHDD
jgi:hypothetical protein